MEDNITSEQLVASIMKNDNLKASKRLEKLLLLKCAKKIQSVLKEQ